jgi:hypothetical protein
MSANTIAYLSILALVLFVFAVGVIARRNDRIAELTDEDLEQAIFRESLQGNLDSVYSRERQMRQGKGC